MSADASAGARLSLFAVTSPGLEALLAVELAALGIEGAAERGGVAWQGPLLDVYAANLRLRTASRILVRVGMPFGARSFAELEERARRLPWERFLLPGRPVRLRVTCHASRLYHEGAVEERLLGAIADRTGATGAVAPAAGDSTVPRTGHAAGPDGAGTDGQQFIVRVHRDRCMVSADASGTHLHRRGYREAVARAPLRETLAAAMLLGSGWTGETPLVDPLCGSGTIVIEAALLARGVVPGLARAGREPRGYAFQQWPSYDQACWREVVEGARGETRPAPPVVIAGSDRDAGAIEAARGNARRAGVLDDLDLTVRPLSALVAQTAPGWLVTNPPYGVRVGDRQRLRDLYASLGNSARRKLPGWSIALLSADRRLDGQVAVPLVERFRTRNGGIPVRLMAGEVPPPS